MAQIFVPSGMIGELPYLAMFSHGKPFNCSVSTPYGHVYIEYGENKFKKLRETYFITICDDSVLRKYSSK
jgi:hypothetical protein